MSDVEYCCSVIVRGFSAQNKLLLPRYCRPTQICRRVLHSQNQLDKIPLIKSSIWLRRFYTHTDICITSMGQRGWERREEEMAD